MPRPSQPLVEPGVVVRQFTEGKASELRALWLRAFGANRHDVNAKDYLWHVFSSGRYPSAELGEAVAQYREQLAAEYVVLSNDGRTAFATDKRPSRASLADYYVFPAILAWTMAFTHETGWLGPYFARHADYERLNEVNLAQVKKKQEAAAARAKGWS